MIRCVDANDTVYFLVNVDLTKTRHRVQNIIRNARVVVCGLPSVSPLPVPLPGSYVLMPPCDFALAQEFLLVRFLEPLLVLAKEAENGRFVLLNEDEDQVLCLLHFFCVCLPTVQQCLTLPHE